MRDNEESAGTEKSVPSREEAGTGTSTAPQGSPTPPARDTSDGPTEPGQTQPTSQPDTNTEETGSSRR